MKPILLFIGIYAPTYHSGGMVRELESMGYDVRVINWQQQRYLLHTQGLNDYILAEANRLLPDLIFMQIQNSEAVYAPTFVQLQQIAPVVNFTFDVRESIDWYKNIAPYISLTCFASEEDVVSCKKSGIDNVLRVHSSCDMNMYRPIHVPDDVRKKYPPIVFLGNDLIRSNIVFPGAEQRKEMVAFLKEKYGNQFGVYGNGWEGSETVYQPEEVNIYNSCKVAVTHNHFNHAGYCSDRGWRAMACGAFTVNHFYHGISDDLGWPNSWASFEMLSFIIDRALRDEYYRSYIAKLTCKEVRERHTWSKRFEKIIKFVKEAKAA